jgi:hypothetical protein
LSYENGVFSKIMNILCFADFATTVNHSSVGRSIIVREGGRS